MHMEDAFIGHEWEADRANRLANAILFWTWYLPRDLVRVRRPHPVIVPATRSFADRGRLAALQVTAQR